MAYSTPAMIRKALVPTSDGTQPTQPTRTAADLTDAQLVDAIAEADSDIDSYIGKFYAVPVALIIDGSSGDGAGVGAIPHPIDYWSRNIAAYNASLAVRGSQDFPETDPVARRYTATMTALRMVSLGQAKLQIPNNTSSNTGVGAGPAINPTYHGDLFDAKDFNLHPLNPTWPMWPDNPGQMSSW